MTTISPLGQTPSAQRAAKPKKAGGAFAPADAGATQTASGAGESAPAETLSALIALQSEDYDARSRGDRRTIAAAQKILEELDSLQRALLAGSGGAGVVKALEAAASLRPHACAAPALAAIYDDIALRAKVELAKRGR